MGILDWFKNRSDQFDTEQVSDELIRLATSTAIALVNPRLKLVRDHEKRLRSSVINTIRFMQGLVRDFPISRTVSADAWAGDASLRAFFVAPADVDALLGRSDELRELFVANPALSEACLVLGMAYEEQQVFGMALRGDVVMRDVAQRTVNFSDHRMRLCAADETCLRRIIGVEVYEHLIGEALADIGSGRSERQNLQMERSLILARLNLLRQQGVGLGSAFDDSPAKASDHERLQTELLENERQLEALGSNEAHLESEFAILKSILDRPEEFLSITPMHLRINAMNVVLDDSSTDSVSVIDFAVVELKGPKPVRRAFILATVARGGIPSPRKIAIDDASRYL